MARRVRRTLGAGGGPILAGAAIVALAGAALLLIVTRQGESAAREQRDDELARSYAVQSRLLEERLARQEIGAVALASWAPQAPGSSDEPLPRWFLSEFDVAAVVTLDGAVVAGSGRLPGEAASLASRFTSGSGLVAHQGELYLIAGREVPGPPPRRVALVGEQLDVPFARAVGDAISVDLAYVLADPAGPRVAASTLARTDADELGRALRRLGDWNAQVAQASRARLDLGGRRFVAMLSPLRAGEEVLGAVVTMAPERSLPALTRSSRAAMLLVGALGLVLGAAVALLGVRRQLRPVLELRAALAATATSAGAAPGVSQEVVAATPAAIAHAVERRLRGEQARGALAHRAHQAAAGRQTAGRGTRLVAGPGVVLALDLRRFAPTAAARHPDLALARYGGDRDLIAQTMASRGGELVAVAGHRLLGVFPRESVGEALLAAVEIGALLQRADSVFDDPLPPAVALAQGDLVRGRIGEGLRAQRAVLGRAVQETDALLREAMPGDLVFSAAVRQSLAEPLAAAGIAIAEQRAVLFPQAIHRVDLASAVGALGSRIAPSSASLTPGVVIGARFEIENPLGESAQGRFYAARDRETGGPAEVLVLDPGAGGGAAAERLGDLGELVQGSRALPPAIVPLLASGSHDGRAYLAASGFAAPTLDAVIGAGGPLAPDTARELALQLARALAAIHRAGLVHGGLRPERVLVGLDGAVRLPWVGLESLVAPRPDSPEVAAYRAPEVQAGDCAVAAASDCWAWAAVVHLALVGAPPAGGSDVGLRAVARLDPALASALQRCLSAEPAGRPASAGVLLGALLGDSRGALLGDSRGALLGDSRSEILGEIGVAGDRGA